MLTVSVEDKESFSLLLHRDKYSEPTSALFNKYKTIVKKILKDSNKTGQLNIVFCSNNYIQALNAQYRKKDKPTNVLSFAFDEPDIIGDVYVSTEYVMANDKMKNLLFIHELGFFIIHGVLHLIGHDHKSNADADAMDKVQNKYFLLLSQSLGRIRSVV